MPMFSRVVVDQVPDVDPYDDMFEYGLTDAVSVALVAGLGDLPSDHPALLAWSQLENEVRDELRPQIARLVTEAFRRRLPWTWDPGE
jgi:hypothetical protein